MGAKLVKDHITEVTPKDQQELIELYHLQMSMQRQKGLGRPTKKERRDIDSFVADGWAENEWDDADDDFDIDFDAD